METPGDSFLKMPPRYASIYSYALTNSSPEKHKWKIYYGIRWHW